MSVMFFSSGSKVVNEVELQCGKMKTLKVSVVGALNNL